MRLPASNPQIGDVYYYPYVWKRQGQHGEPEKDRPCCVTLRLETSKIRGKDTFMLALSQSGYPEDGFGLEVPPEEIARLKRLDQSVTTYLVLSEYNSDVSDSPSFEDLEYIGSFSPKFMKEKVAPYVIPLVQRGTAEIDRTGT